jgi:hypothetical protein
MTHAALVPLVTLLAAGAAGTPVTLDGMTSNAPAAWKETPLPPGGMRFKQFTIPRADGDKFDAELVIFFFGPGGGGGTDANITRWKGFFVPPEGKKIDDVAKTEVVPIGSAKATILDVRGTYKWKPAPMAPNEELRPNHRMIGVVFESPQGPYFMRFVGPEKTVDKNKKDFDRWLRGFAAKKK